MQEGPAVVGLRTNKRSHWKKIRRNNAENEVMTIGADEQEMSKALAGFLEKMTHIDSIEVRT